MATKTDGVNALVRRLRTLGLKPDATPMATALVLQLEEWCVDTPRGPKGLPRRTAGVRS